MIKNGIEISPLHAHAMRRLPEIAMAPGDVHFTPAGSAHLTEQVAKAVEKASQE